MRAGDRVEAEHMASHLPVWLATMEMVIARTIPTPYFQVVAKDWTVRTCRRKSGDLLVRIIRAYDSRPHCRYYPGDQYILYEVAMERLRLMFRGLYRGR